MRASFRVAAAAMHLLGAGTVVELAPAVAAEPACPSIAPPPADLAQWSKRAPLTLAPQGPGPTIAIGKPYDVTLRPDGELRLSNLPGPVKDRVGHGGIASFTVAARGSYRVALGSGVWVDVVRDGKTIESTGHGHGPACSGIRKIVSFDLEPGRYLLTLDGSDAPHTSLLVARGR